MGADPPEVVGQGEPELATNDEWRRIMIAARKDQGFTQETLGARVGTSQNVISLIEKGPPEGIGSSSFILPICRVLTIPPPQHYEDDELAAWSQHGSLLRHKSMAQFRKMMELVKSMVEEETNRK